MNEKDRTCMACGEVIVEGESVIKIKVGHSDSAYREGVMCERCKKEIEKEFFRRNPPTTGRQLNNERNKN